MDGKMQNCVIDETEISRGPIDLSETNSREDN